MRRGGSAPRVRRGPAAARGVRLLGTAVLAALLLAGCDDDAPQQAPPGGDPPGEPAPEGESAAVDPAAVGVTAEPCPDAIDEERGCIHLGSLVDRGEDRASAASDQQLEAQRDFWQRVNEGGGVGGHEIHLDDHVRDVTDDGQEQLDAFEEVVADVLAFALLPGDATSETLADELVAQQVAGVVPGWWSGWHADAYRRSLLLPADYSRCRAVAAGLDWYAEEVEQPLSVLGIAPAGRVADDVAGGGSAWVEAADAAWLGVTEVGRVGEGDQQDAAVQAVIEASPDVVILGAGPQETGEVVRKAAAQGYQGTFLGLVDTWDPELLDAPEREQALVALYRHVGPWEEVASDAGVHAEEVLDARGDEAQLTSSYLTGWLSSYPLLAVLQAAAEQGELSRDGLVGVLEERMLDGEGALSGHDPGSAEPGRVVLSTPDAQATWGLRADTVAGAGPGTQQLDHPEACAPS